MSDDEPTTKSTRQIADEYLREEYGLSVNDLPDDLNRAAFERDLAVRQARTARASIQVAVMALQENRPLEALRTLRESVDELEEELDELDGGLGGDGA